MKQPLTKLLLFVFAGLASCGDEAPQVASYDFESKKQDASTYETKQDTARYEGMNLHDMTYHAPEDKTVDFKKLLLEKSLKHTFSNPAAKDEFKIVVHGEKIYNASIDFLVKNAAGQEIFRDNFPATNILDEAFDGGGHFATDMQKEEYLKKWMYDFFDKENFKQPAIRADKEHNPEYSELQAWNVIKSDSTAIGFVYHKRKNSQTEIAYDKKQNLTIKYFEY